MKETGRTRAEGEGLPVCCGKRVRGFDKTGKCGKILSAGNFSVRAGNINGPLSLCRDAQG